MAVFRAIYRVMLVIYPGLLLVLWVGGYIPRGMQLSYLSRPDSVMGNTRVDVMLYDVRHGLRVPILTLPREAQQLAWSPDGTLAAFFLHASPSNLLIYEPAIQKVMTIPLPDDADTFEHIAWSPAGKQIAVVTYSGVQNAATIIDVETGRVQRQYASEQEISDLSWSPTDHHILALRDGQKIVTWDTSTPDTKPQMLTSGISFAWGGNGEYIISYDTNGIISLTAFNGQPQLIPVNVAPESELVWAPGGGAFLYVSVQVASFDILRYDLNTGRPSTLAGTRTYEGQPVWSPDGRWIAYVATLDGHDNIILYDTRHSARFRLRQFDARDWNPAWRPEKGTTKCPIIC